MAAGNGSEREQADGAAESGGDRRRTLIIIGGGEDKEGEKTILREVARRTGTGKLVVTAVASRQPEAYFEIYEPIFRDLGVRDVVHLEIRDRAEALTEEKCRLLDDATAVFFTGGDQLRITSQIGDTPVEERIREIWAGGGVIAGTSAGASVMCETMLVRGMSKESHRVGSLEMAPGLGLIQDVIIDQHFAERGRMGRLLGSVAENPRVLGIGIDEDTAIVVEDSETFYVLGSGAVYVVDGHGVTHSNVTDREVTVLSLYDVRLHVLSEGDDFNLRARRPGKVIEHPTEKVARRR